MSKASAKAKPKAKKKTATARVPAAGKAKSSKKSSKKPTAQYTIGVGDAAPKLTLPTGDRLGKKKVVVLYFYPKDNTPGCTTEGLDFKKLHGAFEKLGCEIYGVSRDSMKSHAAFGEKCGFPFALLSDENSEICKAFDVIQMKSLYGRKFEGIERSTFVVGKDGTILAEWRKVKVDGHAKSVYDFVCGL